MPSISFPLEIEEMILDLLAEDDEGHSTLKTCSLVCQTLLPICRKHIFGSIVLGSSPTTHAFDRLLRETPEIASYIRKLDCNIGIADMTSPSIQESLKRISMLEFLTIWNEDVTPPARLEWSNNPIRPVLLHLLHLPTLTHFKVTEIQDFDVSDLVSCVNLKYLDIGILWTGAAQTTFPAAFPEHSIQLNEFVAGFRTSNTIMKLCATRPPDGKPIVDFGSLSKITVDIEEPIEGMVTQELFRRCHVLTDVHIYFSDPRNFRPSLADMLRPSMQTLKHIVVKFDVDDDVDPLWGIPSEFEEMRTKNIIETITIEILVPPFRNYHPGDDWGRLDEVLTAPGWFLLKRVSLAIEIVSLYGRNSELEVELRKLPVTLFPRLSSSNSVSFNFEIIPRVY